MPYKCTCTVCPRWKYREGYQILYDFNEVLLLTNDDVYLENFWPNISVNFLPKGDDESFEETTEQDLFIDFY